MTPLILWKNEVFEKENGATDLRATMEHRSKILELSCIARDLGLRIQSGWGPEGYQDDYTYWIDFNTQEEAIEFKLKYL
jgi:hypothetical protein